MNIENKIQAGGTNLDIGYWESLLQQVRVYMARARYVSHINLILFENKISMFMSYQMQVTLKEIFPCCRLRERHQDVLRQKLYKLKQEQGVESEPLFPIIKDEPENEQPV